MDYNIYEPMTGDLICYTLLEVPGHAGSGQQRILVVIDPKTNQVLDETGNPITLEVRFTPFNPWLKNITVSRAGVTIIDWEHDGIPSKGMKPRV